MVVLSDSLNKQVFPGLGLHYLDSTSKRFKARTDALNKQLDTLLLMDLDFNDNRIIDLLTGMHHNFSQLIICADTVHNATGKMICNYQRAWNKINDQSKL